MKDYVHIDTSEPMNKYEKFIKGAAFVISFVAGIVYLLSLGA